MHAVISAFRTVSCPSSPVPVLVEHSNALGTTSAVVTPSVRHDIDPPGLKKRTMRVQKDAVWRDMRGGRSKGVGHNSPLVKLRICGVCSDVRAKRLTERDGRNQPCPLCNTHEGSYNHHLDGSPRRFRLCFEGGCERPRRGRFPEST